MVLAVNRQDSLIQTVVQVVLFRTTDDDFSLPVCLRLYVPNLSGCIVSDTSLQQIHYLQYEYEKDLA